VVGEEAAIRELPSSRFIASPQASESGEAITRIHPPDARRSSARMPHARRFVRSLHRQQSRPCAVLVPLIPAGWRSHQRLESRRPGERPLDACSTWNRPLVRPPAGQRIGRSLASAPALLRALITETRITATDRDAPMHGLRIAVRWVDGSNGVPRGTRRAPWPPGGARAGASTMRLLQIQCSITAWRLAASGLRQHDLRAPPGTSFHAWRATVFHVEQGHATSRIGSASTASSSASVHQASR
jgi:hypothetical protein